LNRFTVKGLAGPLLLLAAASTHAAPAADEKQQLLELKNTVVNLVDALVKQGVLQPELAASLVKKAETDAATQAAQQVAMAADEAAPVAEAGASAAPGKVVRVPYVPEFVKKEIREQVRAELREDVLSDVSQKAKQERWGTPDALPAWVNNIKISGDARVRNEYNKYGKDNADTLSAQNLYLDIPRVNAAGGISQAGARAFLNTSEDNNRWRERVRLNLRAAITDHWTFDTRVATGNQTNPVSTNQTLGSGGQRFSIQLDRAALLYELPAEQGFGWLNSTLNFAAGRIANPWISTDLVWDEDLNFDGAALSLKRVIGQEEGISGLGPSGRHVFATVGLFPLQQVEFSSQDKWLAAGQLGASWEFENQNKLTFASAYYRYIHVTGKKNALGSTLSNSTQPTFLQKGNLLYNIANDPNLNGGADDALFALAADYHLLDLNLSLDLATFAPYHVIFKGDVVKNLGYARDEVARRTGGVTYLYSNGERTLGWLFEMVAGWPQVTKFRDWQVSASYRYLQRDAVLDAFTDSDFHLGGTDTKGWVLGGKYGVARNTWLQLRYLSSAAIDGPPLDIDTLQVDLNAKF
jgi:hypothetical protein